MNRFHPDQPLILGLCGEAATGKSVTASALCPSSRFGTPEEDVFWDHLYFALPLYRMANARLQIEGTDAFSRQSYEIHATLTEVFGRSLPYDDLVEAVYEIMALPIEREGKPRTFLQHVGTEICRAIDPDCWVKWMERKVKLDYRNWRAEREAEEEKAELRRAAGLGNDEMSSAEMSALLAGKSINITEEDEVFPGPSIYGVVISDARFPNEAQWVAQQPNGLLLRLTCDSEVRAQRVEARDGIVMSPEQKSHASEVGIQNIHPELFNATIDTTELTMAEQVKEVRRVINAFIGGRLA